MLGLLTILLSLTLVYMLNMYWYSMVWTLCFCFMVSLLMFPNAGSGCEVFSGAAASDNMSNLLTTLTVWITILMLLASQKMYINKKKTKLFVKLILILSIILCITFNVSDAFIFYFMFESSLVPTLLLILGWGYQPERMQAGMYMMMYTLWASLPLLAGIVWMSTSFYSSKMLIVSMLRLGLEQDINYSNLMYYVMFMAFLVKLPVFPAHLWLPKAHVEAPVAGSMVLAAILLKLGGYGLLRMHSLMGYSTNIAILMMLSIGVWGGVMSSIICFRQVDLKALIAYSSVGHMSFVLVGVFSDVQWGWNGSLLLMLAHGFTSSALFSLSGYSYEYFMTRSMLIMKGMLLLMPSFTLWWFIFCIMNMAAPPSINLVGELMIFISCLSYSWLFLLSTGLMMFLSCVYSMYLYTSTQHGMSSGYLNFIGSFKSSGNLVLFLHLVPSVILILSVSGMGFM
uniref:NADH-ubiquinone oxidoreductase chain 4 n=1 Tax=Thylaeodus sp. TAR-2010 TaxID=765162 RepID=E2FLW0_9CAEN|nr:NADH dehydrogenase subunit 4 [Thylaeodus sp. TAR-2010]